MRPVRAVALSDLTNPEALDVARERLSRLGVDRALARAGARTGDVVHIGDFAFDYESDARWTCNRSTRRRPRPAPSDRESGMRVVAKIGTSSLTDEHGVIDRVGVAKAADEVALAACGVVTR